MGALLTASGLRRSAEEEALRRELPVGAEVDLSRLDDVDLRRTTRQLSRLRSSCGCRVGEIGTLVALVSIGFCWSLGGWISSPGTVLRGVLLSILQLIAGGVLGKVAGLAFAQIRYRSLVRELTSREGSRSAT